MVSFLLERMKYKVLVRRLWCRWFILNNYFRNNKKYVRMNQRHPHRAGTHRAVVFCLIFYVLIYLGKNRAPSLSSETSSPCGRDRELCRTREDAGRTPGLYVLFRPITLDALVAVFATNSGIAPHMLHECCTAVPIGPAQAYASCVGAGEKARV